MEEGSSLSSPNKYLREEANRFAEIHKTIKEAVDLSKKAMKDFRAIEKMLRKAAKWGNTVSETSSANVLLAASIKSSENCHKAIQKAIGFTGSGGGGGGSRSGSGSDDNDDADDDDGSPGGGGEDGSGAGVRSQGKRKRK
ncbi:hypothetical protein ACFE04_003789 [Oxalis oulophora]